MATKGKGTTKAAPAPAQEEAEGFEKGQRIKFLGYGPDVKEEEQVLAADEIYEVVDVTEEGNPVVRIENPDFDSKKKENANTNPKFLEVEALPEEVELVEEVAEGEGAPAAEAEAAPAQAAPARGKGKATAAEKPAAKTETKGKATAPAKAKGKAVAKPEPVDADAEQKDEDDLPELENEDENVLDLIKGNDDIIAVAQDLEAQVGQTEWQLGGLLYHIRKDKLHRTLTDDKGKPIAEYSEKGGFAAFLRDYFNLDYRKAMYLIEIYVNFTQAGIEDAAGVVARIGWTKASKIAKPLIAEDANVDDLIELAETSTVADLSEAIKEQVTVGGTKGEGGEKKTRITMKFRYFEEEAESINAILEAAKEQLGLKDIGEALSHIVQEWATEHAGGAAEVETAAPSQKAAPAGRAAPKARGARAAA